MTVSTETARRYPAHVPRASGRAEAGVLFVTTCPAPWGGSEELWSRAAHHLAGIGVPVAAVKIVPHGDEPHVRRLVEAGVRVHTLRAGQLRRIGKLLTRDVLPLRLDRLALRLLLRWHRPRLVLISQGMNYDGADFAEECRASGVRYCLLSQSAGEAAWPGDVQRPAMKAAYAGASASFFVSRHNLRLTELQLGTSLPHASVVENPCNVSIEGALPWPGDEGETRLACVARLDLEAKGQDTLLQVLATEKWRRRPLRVGFFGVGRHRDSVVELARFLGLSRVTFPGFVPDVTSVFREHHALILPSRHEGLPLALVEAMMCGRPPIVSDAGGNAELIEDGVTGFVARGSDVRALDDVLERAFAQRQAWQAIGSRAAERIRQRYPQRPEVAFAQRLLAL
jgi:glycosyltransferase involved in cell wall biosynthesis